MTHATVHHGTNDQSRKTAEQMSGCYYQLVDSQESDHPYQVNESKVDNAVDTVGKDTSTISGQELPGQCAHDIDGVNSVDKATDMNGNLSKDSDHTIDAENTTVAQPDCTLDSVEVNTRVRQMILMVIQVKNLMLQLMQRIAILMGLILFMTVPKQLTQMLSRQNQLLILMLIVMMYHKKNYQFNLLMKVRKSIHLISQLI